MKRFIVAVTSLLGISLQADGTAKTNPVLLADFLMKDWGTWALFDKQYPSGTVEDICGTLNGNFYYGRAYNNHKGWDRDIPNTNGPYIVFSMAAGVVKEVEETCNNDGDGCNNGFGNTVLIDHGNGVKTRCMHFAPNSVLVTENQWVDRYFPIAAGGNSGNSEGPHVHCETTVDDVYVDPLDLGSQTKIQWMHEPNIDYSKCPEKKDPVHFLINPYTLEEYVFDQIFAAANPDTWEPWASLGWPPEIKWLNNSNGSDLNDVLFTAYQKNSQTTYVVFDLIRNAPEAIVLQPPIGNAWKTSFGKLGAPLGSPYSYEKNGKFATRLDCRWGYLFQEQPSLPVKVVPYPSEIAAGEFEGKNGQLNWKGGFSYSFYQKYRSLKGAESVGDANEYGMTWGETKVVYQTFDGGEFGACALLAEMNLLSGGPYTVYLLRDVFWKKYQEEDGPNYFGLPLGDDYFDPFFDMRRQDFENNESIFENGEILPYETKCIPSVTEAYNACGCPGAKKSEPCGKCGKQEYFCSEYLWKPLGTCTEQGMCVPEEEQTTSCGCFGLKLRVCGSNCQWTPWSPCYENQKQEVCNKLDDDCDGQTDEGEVCCQPIAEVCDGKDNDCDNLVDEGVKNACGGCKTLPSTPGNVCGQNAWYICDTPDSLFCWYAFFGDPPQPEPEPSPQPEPTPDPEPEPQPEPPPPEEEPSDQPPPSSCGECSPGQSESKKCDPGTYCGPGQKTRTCKSSCSWGSWSDCSAASGPKYGYEGGTKCGDIVCVTISSSSESSISVKISKVGGKTFSSNPVEWKLQTTSGKTVANAPGGGCEASYGGQTEFIASFDPSKYELDEDGVMVKFWSGQNCSELYTSPYVYFSKCK